MSESCWKCQLGFVAVLGLHQQTTQACQSMLLANDFVEQEQPHSKVSYAGINLPKNILDVPYMSSSG